MVCRQCTANGQVCLSGVRNTGRAMARARCCPRPRHPSGSPNSRPGLLTSAGPVLTVMGKWGVTKRWKVSLCPADKGKCADSTGYKALQVNGLRIEEHVVLQLPRPNKDPKWLRGSLPAPPIPP